MFRPTLLYYSRACNLSRLPPWHNATLHGFVLLIKLHHAHELIIVYKRNQDRWSFNFCRWLITLIAWLTELVQVNCCDTPTISIFNFSAVLSNELLLHELRMHENHSRCCFENISECREKLNEAINNFLGLKQLSAVHWCIAQPDQIWRLYKGTFPW